jgi:hypothetical protein
MLLYAHMVSVYVLVLGNEKLARPESSAAAQMAHHRAGEQGTGRPAAEAPLVVSEPSDRHPMAPNRTYPFGRHLAKESLGF